MREASWVVLSCMGKLFSLSPLSVVLAVLLVALVFCRSALSLHILFFSSLLVKCVDGILKISFS